MSAETLSRPWFDIEDLPLSDEQLLARETWMMEEGNWREDHSIPSAGNHYRYMWKWDSLKAVAINARRGDPDRAALEFATLEQYRDPQTGFMPNKIFATASHKTWRDYPEAWNFNNNRVGTSYSQPPINAWAAMETYESFSAQGREDEGLAFLASAYGMAEPGNYTGLQGEHAYFINHRQNSPDDPLIGVVHPNETGRDSDQANKPWEAFAKGLPNAKREWLHMQKLGYDLGRLGRDPEGKRIDWIPEQTRQKYWVNDVMFNAMHAKNLRHLADIAGILSDTTDSQQQKEQYGQEILKYRTIANNVEKEILDRMWNSSDGFFYNLDEHGEQIPVESVTGLFALMLDNIRDKQATSLFNKLEDGGWFGTPYPIPSHAVRSRFYDPEPAWFNRKFTPWWSGSVWLSPNEILTEEGLVRRAVALLARGERQQAERVMKIGGHIADKTVEMLAINPKSMEYYSPITGKGMRVEDFMWSQIGLHFEKYRAAAEAMRAGKQAA